MVQRKLYFLTVYIVLGLTISTLLLSIYGVEEIKGQSAQTDILDETIFQDMVLNKESKLIFRSAFGDIIPGNGHQEIATCSKNGRITVTYGSDMTWTTELAHWSYINGNPNDPAEVYSIAVDDIYPEYPGDEIVTVDMDYSVKITRYTDDGWTTEIIWQDDDWLYEVSIGEVVSSISGPEIVVVGETQRATILTRSDNGWDSELLFRDNFAIDTCFIDDLDPNEPGNEILVAGIDSNVTLITGSPGSWVYRDIAFLGSSIIDILTTDLDPNIQGREIYASTFKGEVWQIDPTDMMFGKVVVHTEGAMAYGIEAGTIEGVNVISMGTWNNRVALLHYNNGFKVREVYREEYIILGTGIFDLDPYHKGNEIFALTGLGYLRMIYHDDPSWDLKLPFTKTTLSEGESMNLPFIIRYKGGYQGEAQLQVNYENNEGTIEPPLSLGPGIHSINIDSSQGDIYFAGDGWSKTLEVIVNTDNITNVDFAEATVNRSVGLDRQIQVDLMIESDTDIQSPFTFITSSLPSGMNVVMNPGSVDPLGLPLNATATISVRTEVDPIDHYIFIIGYTSGGKYRAVGLTIDVFQASVQDFEVVIEDSPPVIKKGENTTINIELIPRNGFSENISLGILEGIEDLNITLAENKAKPPANVVMDVQVLEDDGPYFITVVGISGELTRMDTIRINTEPPRKDLLIELPEGPFILQKNDEGLLETNIGMKLRPLNGILTDLEVLITGLSSNETAKFTPSDLTRIPYPLTVTLFVNLKDEDMEGDNRTITITFMSKEEKRNWTIDLELEKPARTFDKGPNITPFIVGGIILVLLIVGALLLYRNILPNALNREEEVEGKDESRKGNGPFRHHQDDKGGKRPYNRYSGVDRLGGGRR